jgi:hypothetical protein
VLDLAVEAEAEDDGLEICGKDEPRGEKRKGEKYKKMLLTGGSHILGIFLVICWSIFPNNLKK